VIKELKEKDQLTVRIAYNLFTQKPKEELADFKNWTSQVTRAELRIKAAARKFQQTGAELRIRHMICG
jgi:predicted amidohydrolase YtcJ